MQANPFPITNALSGAALLFAINASLLTLIPLSLLWGLDEISYLRRPDLVYLIWTLLLLYPSIMALPVMRAIMLWLRLRPVKKRGGEPDNVGLVIATSQLAHLRYWGRLLMLANLLYLPFLLLGLF
ncbi:hypothetical protein [Aeromonas sp. MdU4]|uniref:hypothetical protein n=1 Tax=Aeromonas sp. MdU4 TaxID=3342819 RepID=UPI0035BA7ECD